MKRLISAAVLFAFLAPVAAFAEDIAGDSKIAAVTVYADRAKITRTATVSIPAGSHTVIFANMPPTLFPDSLRAEGSAKADVKFGAVSHKRVMSAQLTSAREEELNKKLETLQDQISEVTAEKTAVEMRKNFLGTLGQQAALRSGEDIAEINLKPDQWAATAQAIYTGTAEALKAILQLDLKLRELNREAARVKAELAQLRTDQRSTFTVAVPLEASSATELKLELSYQIPQATWSPLYDARLTSEGKGDLKLIQYGAVSQRTGEDWTGVKLTLSTAQPQRGASLPDLTPMWVNAYQGGRDYEYDGAQKSGSFRAMSSNMAPSGQAGAMMAMDSVAEMGVPAVAPPPPPEEREATFATAQINTGGFVTEYAIPGPATVIADGTETKLMVGAFETQSKLEIHVKPQMSSDAFLVSKLLLKGDSPILPGQVNLFRDGAFVGQSRIKLLRPDEEYGLYFGIDDQVAVKRKVLKDESQEQGMISRDNVLVRQYVTEVQNLHTTPIDLVVKETIPAPRNEKVKSELQRDFTTPGFTEDSVNIKGLLEWKFKMEPKSKQDVKLGWTLSWPKDFTLDGLR